MSESLTRAENPDQRFNGIFISMNDVDRMAMSSEVFAPTLFDAAAFDALLNRPESSLQGHFNAIPYTARVVIPNYGAHVARHYASVMPNGLAMASAYADIPFHISQFGLIIEFDRAAHIALHGDDLILAESVRDLVARFGVVVFRNACIAGAARNKFHRNIFPHLQFHLDRSPGAANQYSCFTRDPDDAAQRGPRATSTLFIANLVAWLELVRADGCDPREERGVRMSYNLYPDAARDLFGDVILEQPWDAPEGTGEIAVIDNRTVLHASYHKDGRTKGYAIGARYLI